MTLNQNQINRFKRHILLDDVGIKGQQKILNSSVIVVGAGGLGSPALLYLSASGIGKIGIIDGDKVEVSNLQRQIIHGEDDLGDYKVLSAKKSLLRNSSSTVIETYNTNLSKDNAKDILSDYDIVLDATDNFKTRYLINEICNKLNKPLVSASILSYQAHISVFNYKNGPCYSCLFPEPPPSDVSPNCSEAGIFGVLTGIVGSMQANEVLKLIIAPNHVLNGKLLTFDSQRMEFKHLNFEKDSSCNVCSPTSVNPSLDNKNTEELKIQNDKALFSEITPKNLSKRIIQEESIVIDIRSAQEIEIASINSINIPLYDLAYEIIKYPKDTNIYIICHKGKRSLKACKLLIEMGYSRVTSVKGGIDRWALEVDPTLLRY